MLELYDGDGLALDVDKDEAVDPDLLPVGDDIGAFIA